MEGIGKGPRTRWTAIGVTAGGATSLVTALTAAGFAGCVLWKRSLPEVLFSPYFSYDPREITPALVGGMAVSLAAAGIFGFIVMAIFCRPRFWGFRSRAAQPEIDNLGRRRLLWAVLLVTLLGLCLDGWLLYESRRRYQLITEHWRLNLVCESLRGFARMNHGYLPDTMGDILEASTTRAKDFEKQIWPDGQPKKCGFTPLSMEPSIFASYTHRKVSAEAIARGESDFVYLGAGLRITWNPEIRPPYEPLPLSVSVAGQSVASGKVILLHTKPEVFHGWCNVFFLDGHSVAVKSSNMAATARRYGWIYPTPPK